MKLSFFSLLSLLTVPIAAVLEIAYLDLGHDPTYFGAFGAGHAPYVRYVALSLAVASVICALAFRSTRR